MYKIVKNIQQIMGKGTLRQYYLQMENMSLKFTNAEIEAGLGDNFPMAVLAHLAKR